jgi:hypothetical protein
VRVPVALLLASLAASPVLAQFNAGTIMGTVTDEQHGMVVGASVTVRNVDTGLSRTVTTDNAGRFRMPNLPPGNYSITVDLTGFASYVRSGVTLAVNQDAVVDVLMKPATLTETITVQSDAPLLDTTSAQVGVRFDTKRVAELPVSNQRDVYALALSAPGVSQLGSGQTGFAAGTNFAVNGGRVRSNNFMIDGQDSNDPSVTGRTQPINMTDIVQEIRLVTNQFTAEYGRAAGSVMNVVTKSGTNAFHGSASWFANRDGWNSRSNLDEAAGRTEAPFRETNQFGGTFGGPIVKDRTFFFAGYQRWTDKALGAGQTLNGAPTEAGRQVLQSAAGHLPQVAALLQHLPAAQTPIGRSASFTLGGRTYVVPLGSITNSADQDLVNDQAMVRLDHNFSPNHTLSARYLYNDQLTTGFGSQVTPAGLLNISPTTQHAGNLWLTSVLSNKIVNELRFAVQTLDTATQPQDPTSLEIPSIEISELGLSGFNAGATRTAIGYGVNLPQSRKNQTWQIQETFSYISGNHAWKMGFDVRRNNVDSNFNPTVRGRLAYSTLQNYVDDIALSATINKPLPGGQLVVNYKWDDYYVFIQDEWRVAPSLTLTLGARYELPGNAVESLVDLNGNIMAIAGNDPRYALSPVPDKDKNNFQPRVGFNWNPQTDKGGLLGFITGGDKLVIRGGFARTNDYQFLNLALNIASSFPFVGAINLAPSRQADGSNGVSNAFGRLPGAPVTGNPMLFTRTVVAEDFRAPILDQFSFELQRQMTENLVFRAGYIGTKGKDLFQSLEGNPILPFSTVRADPTRGLIRTRTNTGESTYHSLQLSAEQRFSKGFSAGLHYTWSSFKDDGSDTFNPSAGEVATPQDPHAIDDGEFAPSTYDRPHRFTVNFVWELPVLKDQRGFLGKVFGGWQISTLGTWQSGVPFTVFNGADPTGQHAGSLVGNPIRPNLNTDLDLSGMSIQEVLDAGGASLFTRLCGNPSATCPGQRVGNAPRNLLRSDRLLNVDFALIKNTRIAQTHNLQIRFEMYNATNSRSFGIPNSAINSANFLNEKGTNGGNRFIWLSARYSF